jgi:RimJ/RimL family protein N-acetyltransferase
MAEVMRVEPVTLTGRFVRLEPLSEEHVPGLAAIGLEDDIWRFMPYGQMRTDDDIRNWVRLMLSLRGQGADMPFAVIDLASNCVAGCTRYLEIRPAHRGLEIGGTWYGAAYRRTRVNTESKYLLLEHAFERLGCVRVQIKTDSRNERSQRAIERLGAKKEGVLRKQMVLPDGHIRDSVYYSILDSEWPAVKARLLELLAR